MLSIYSFGEVLIDFIPVESNNYHPFVGGAPANVAAAVAKLGGNSYFIGGISQDSFGINIQQQMQKIGIKYKLSPIKKEKTAMVIVSLDESGERHFHFYRDNTADLAISVEDLVKIDWQQTGIFHFCSNTLLDLQSLAATKYALEQVCKSKGIISFDVNLRQNLWPDDNAELIINRVCEMFVFCDIVKFSNEELSYVCQVKNISHEDLLESIFSTGVKVILVTAGPEPVKIFTQACIFEVAVPIVKSIDTTAGGDSFIGAFLYQLSLQRNIQQALNSKDMLTELVKFSALCSAKTVSRKGAFEALPFISEI